MEFKKLVPLNWFLDEKSVNDFSNFNLSYWQGGIGLQCFYLRIVSLILHLSRPINGLRLSAWVGDHIKGSDAKIPQRWLYKRHERKRRQARYLFAAGALEVQFMSVSYDEYHWMERCINLRNGQRFAHQPTVESKCLKHKSNYKSFGECRVSTQVILMNAHVTLLQIIKTSIATLALGLVKKKCWRER